MPQSPKTEESSHEQIKSQDNGHRFFYSHGAVLKEFVSSGVSESKILSSSPGPYEKQGGVSSNGNYRQLNPSSFITTMLLRGLICSHALISRTFSSLSTVLFDNFFMSHTETVTHHFFTSLDTHDSVGTGESGYL
jgi:hypothetical protein